MNKRNIALISLIIFLFGPGTCFAGGLSTHFVEVKLENLEPGNTYSVKKEAGYPLIVQNTTKDKTVDMEIAPEKPVDYNLVQGYEPIPDLAWVKVEKSTFVKLGPGESAETDITITIPDNKEYYGKRYQVYIYSHTAGSGSFRLGIMSRVLLSTASL